MHNHGKYHTNQNLFGGQTQNVKIKWSLGRLREFLGKQTNEGSYGDDRGSQEVNNKFHANEHSMD